MFALPATSATAGQVVVPLFVSFDTCLLLCSSVFCVPYRLLLVAAPTRIDSQHAGRAATAMIGLRRRSRLIARARRLRYLASPVSSCSPPPLWPPRAHSETGMSTWLGSGLGLGLGLGSANPNPNRDRNVHPAAARADGCRVCRGGPRWRGGRAATQARCRGVAARAAAAAAF